MLMDNKGAIFGGTTAEQGPNFESRDQNFEKTEAGTIEAIQQLGHEKVEQAPVKDGSFLKFPDGSEVMDANRDGVVSMTEQLEYIDDQGLEIPKNLKKLSEKNVQAVEKDIDRFVKNNDAYGAVISLGKWRDKMLLEAFGRRIGDRNAA